MLFFLFLFSLLFRGIDYYASGFRIRFFTFLSLNHIILTHLAFKLRLQTQCQLKQLNISHFIAVHLQKFYDLALHNSLLILSNTFPNFYDQITRILLKQNISNKQYQIQNFVS